MASPGNSSSLPSQYWLSPRSLFLPRMAPSSSVQECALYVGINIQQFLTGLAFCVGCFAVHFIRCNKSMTRGWKIVYLLYVVVIVFCMTIAVFANAYIGQLMWIDHRDAPGGPFAYFIAESTLWTSVWGSAMDIFANIIGDGFLLYRCYVIWYRSWWIILFPAIIYIASVVLSIIALVESALPVNNSFFSFAHVSFTIPWIALSCTLNIILTAMISFRILRFRQQLVSVLKHDPHLLFERSQYLNTYTSIVAILIESAFPFSVIGLVTCVFLGQDSDVNSAFLEIWGVFPGISPLLIVLRIAMGTAWTEKTSELPTRSFIPVTQGTVVPISGQRAAAEDNEFSTWSSISIE